MWTYSHSKHQQLVYGMKLLDRLTDSWGKKWLNTNVFKVKSSVNMQIVNSTAFVCITLFI